ncbi:MAG: hypothetical protein ACOYN0_06445 [Phycisphaerales bacterium]
MEPVHANPIPLAAPNSAMNTLLTNFFDPAHTLQSIANSLGLTLEGLLNYIATPEVAAALDHAEDLFLRRTALRATEAIESVRQQLQSLPPRPATPSHADTDRRRESLEATRRTSDVLRTTISPLREPSQQPPRPRSITAPSTATARSDSPPSRERHHPRAEPSTHSRPAWRQRAIAFAPPTPAAPRAHSAGSSVSTELRRAFGRGVAREASLYQGAPALVGTPYTRGQAG